MLLRVVRMGVDLLSYRKGRPFLRLKSIDELLVYPPLTIRFLRPTKDHNLGLNAKGTCICIISLHIPESMQLDCVSHYNPGKAHIYNYIKQTLVLQVYSRPEISWLLRHDFANVDQEIYVLVCS